MGSLPPVIITWDHQLRVLVISTMKPVITFIACILISSRLYAHTINADTLIVQNDTSICAGNSVNLSIDLPSVTGIVFLAPGSEFEYSFEMPPAGWQTGSGGWTLGNAPFGNESGGDPPEFDYATLWTANVPDHADGFDLYVRKTIDLTGQDLTHTFWHLGVDNGYALYINGVQISAGFDGNYTFQWEYEGYILSLIHISEPTRLLSISYAVFCLK